MAPWRTLLLRSVALLVTMSHVGVLAVLSFLGMAFQLVMAQVWTWYGSNGVGSNVDVVWLNFSQCYGFTASGFSLTTQAQCTTLHPPIPLL